MMAEEIAWKLYPTFHLEDKVFVEWEGNGMAKHNVRKDEENEGKRLPRKWEDFVIQLK